MPLHMYYHRPSYPSMTLAGDVSLQCGEKMPSLCGEIQELIMLRGMHNAWWILKADIWSMSRKYSRHTYLYRLTALILPNSFLSPHHTSLLDHFWPLRKTEICPGLRERRVGTDRNIGIKLAANETGSLGRTRTWLVGMDSKQIFHQ